MGEVRQFLTFLVTLCVATPAAAERAPLPIKVVVVTAFEIGEDTGDRAGEFQAWAEVMPAKIAR